MAKTTLTKVAVLLLVLVLGYALGRYQGAAPERITEDDPRWDCHTMGNNICGQQVSA